MAARQNTALNVRKSKQAIPSHPFTQQPFPFSRLPHELRYEIYLLCLASKSTTSIVVDEEEERLKLHWESWCSRNFTLETGLLHLNRSIYDEASSVLYGHNSFQFLGSEGWIHFHIFERRLTEASRQHLRSLEFNFLSDGWDSTARSERAGWDAGIESLKGLQRLNTLTLRITRNITGHDIAMLRKIRDNCPHGCRIVLTIPKNVVDRRVVRIAHWPLLQMREWNWIIDQNARRYG